MAMLKPPKVGRKVSIHQDTTFLFGEPDTLLGFWIPLQDATINNGCLWGIPGSHNGPLYRRSKAINGIMTEEQYLEPNYK
jgi:phytanoyl-CoA hydroxylase